MLLRFTGGGTVDADGEHAKRLVAAGWTPVKTEEKKDEPTPAPKRTRRRKPAE